MRNVIELESNFCVIFNVFQKGFINPFEVNVAIIWKPSINLQCESASIFWIQDKIEHKYEVQKKS